VRVWSLAIVVPRVTNEGTDGIGKPGREFKVEGEIPVVEVTRAGRSIIPGRKPRSSPVT
jgi:hypothetical protein